MSVVVQKKIRSLPRLTMVCGEKILTHLAWLVGSRLRKMLMYYVKVFSKWRFFTKVESRLGLLNG